MKGYICFIVLDMGPECFKGCNFCNEGGPMWVVWSEQLYWAGGCLLLLSPPVCTACYLHKDFLVWCSPVRVGISKNKSVAMHRGCNFSMIPIVLK